MLSFYYGAIMTTITIEKKEGEITQKNSLKIPNELATLSEVFDGFMCLLQRVGYTQEEIDLEINEICLDSIREAELSSIIHKCQRT
jgi:hypothetical protein